MAATGADIARMLLSSAAIQADLRIQDSRFRRQLHEISQQQSLERIQIQNEINQQKKAARKARKKKNVTLAVAAVSAVFTGGASLSAIPGAISSADNAASAAKGAVDTLSSGLSTQGTTLSTIPGLSGIGSVLTAQAQLASNITSNNQPTFNLSGFQLPPIGGQVFSFDYLKGLQGGLEAFGLYNRGR